MISLLTYCLHVQMMTLIIKQAGASFFMWMDENRLFVSAAVGLVGLVGPMNLISRCTSSTIKFASRS